MTGLFNVVGTLEQKIYHIYQNGTSQLIKVSSIGSASDDFEVRFSTLKAELDRVQQLIEGGGFNAVVGYFKFLTNVTVWMRSNLPSDAPNFEHFIDLDILLEGI